MLKQLLVAAALALPSAAQQPLVDRYDETVLREVATSLGYKVVDVLENADKPSMTVEVDGSLAFQIEGLSCTGEGADQKCLGLHLAAILAGAGDNDPEELIAEINRTWRPGKLFAVSQGLAFERYLILDDGISRGNLASNIETFGEMLKALWARVRE